jgi:hypothetical protein
MIGIREAQRRKTLASEWMTSEWSKKLERSRRKARSEVIKELHKRIFISFFKQYPKYIPAELEREITSYSQREDLDTPVRGTALYNAYFSLFLFRICPTGFSQGLYDFNYWVDTTQFGAWTQRESNNQFIWYSLFFHFLT